MNEIPESGEINLYSDKRNDENDILQDVLLEDERVRAQTSLQKLYAINPSTAAKGINYACGCENLRIKKEDWSVCGDGTRVIRTSGKPVSVKLNNMTASEN